MKKNYHGIVDGNIIRLKENLACIIHKPQTLDSVGVKRSGLRHCLGCGNRFANFRNHLLALRRPGFLPKMQVCE
ncbi:hypothetical protein IH824_20835 [candidate division KSB1 bacterium]|nr:hypothetical protein [candidate division KSB1 bacterium]